MSDGETSDGSTRQSADFWEHQWLWWDRLASPLRPSLEDIALLEQMLDDERTRRERPLVRGDAGSRLPKSRACAGPQALASWPSIAARA